MDNSYLSSDYVEIAQDGLYTKGVSKIWGGFLIKKSAQHEE